MYGLFTFRDFRGFSGVWWIIPAENKPYMYPYRQSIVMTYTSRPAQMREVDK